MSVEVSGPTGERTRGPGCVFVVVWVGTDLQDVPRPVVGSRSESEDVGVSEDV